MPVSDQYGSSSNPLVSANLKSVARALVCRGTKVTQAMSKHPPLCTGNKKPTSQRDASDTLIANILPEEQFRQALCKERKRSERSRKQILLLLIGSKDLTGRECDACVSKQVAESVCRTIRETDLAGWFEE